MSYKYWLIRAATVILLAAAAVIVYLVFFKSQPNIIYHKPTATQSGASVAVTPKRVAIPAKITIPALSINSAVQQVGIDGDGQMEVPTNWIDVGWYKFGARPGEIGNAVIDGHYDGPKGEPGVFLDLRKLKTGDQITITDEANKTHAFVVSRTDSVSASTAKLDAIFGPSSSAHLNLITCNGPWDKNKKQFQERLIVYADLVK